MAQVVQAHECLSRREAPVVGLPPMEMEASEHAGAGAREIRLEHLGAGCQPFLAEHFGHASPVVLVDSGEEQADPADPDVDNLRHSRTSSGTRSRSTTADGAPAAPGRSPCRSSRPTPSGPGWATAGAGGPTPGLATRAARGPSASSARGTARTRARGGARRGAPREATLPTTGARPGRGT